MTTEELRVVELAFGPNKIKKFIDAEVSQLLVTEVDKEFTVCDKLIAEQYTNHVISSYLFKE